MQNSFTSIYNNRHDEDQPRTPSSVRGWEMHAKYKTPFCTYMDPYLHQIRWLIPMC